jgi:hypothetical protein
LTNSVGREDFVTAAVTLPGCGRLECPRIRVNRLKEKCHPASGSVFPFTHLSEFLFVTIGPSAFLALVRIDFMAFPLFSAGHQASMFATVERLQ